MNSLKLFKQKRLVAKKSDFSDIYQSNYNISQPFYLDILYKKYKIHIIK